MKDTWSLDALYQGYEDPQFLDDLTLLEKQKDHLNITSQKLSHTDEEHVLVQVLQEEERFFVLLGKLSSYMMLRQACDTTDAKTVALMGQLEQISSDATKAITKIERYIQECDNLDTWIDQNAFLKEYAYVLKETKKDGRYHLSDDVEEVIAKLNISAGNAWSNLQEYLTSTLKVNYHNKVLTLSEVRNLAYDSNKNVRKAAYEAEIKAYDSIKQSVAFALNHIKSQVNTISDLRGFPSPLDMTLYYSRMEKSTLNAMMKQINAYLPVFHSYLKTKARLLGYPKQLPWYELFAPLSADEKSFTLDEAHHYLIQHFRPFADDLADMIDQAFEDAWIDFYPRNGKVGGAFCANLTMIKQSRILTNFDGSLGDVVTLAHELGHAYHGKMIESHRPLNTNYSMPVAETASTFNEIIIMNAAIQEENDPKIKCSLIENQLQNLTQIICDIYSRFLFEQRVFEKRRSAFLFADDLCEMMLEAQKEAYGDAIDPDTLHPYMWINKSHYYSPSLSFYNFPYAFGGLFARGLVAQYEQQGASFVEKYQQMLHATTISSVEEVANMAGIDLSAASFWISSLESCKKTVDEFIELADQLFS